MNINLFILRHDSLILHFINIISAFCYNHPTSPSPDDALWARAPETDYYQENVWPEPVLVGGFRSQPSLHFCFTHCRLSSAMSPASHSQPITPRTGHLAVYVLQDWQREPLHQQGGKPVRLLSLATGATQDHWSRDEGELRSRS